MARPRVVGSDMVTSSSTAETSEGGAETEGPPFRVAAAKKRVQKMFEGMEVSRKRLTRGSRLTASSTSFDLQLRCKSKEFVGRFVGETEFVL